MNSSRSTVTQSRSLCFGMPFTSNEHDHQIPLIERSTHMTTEGPQGDNGDIYPTPEDVHLATIEEKKRFWLRDALINSLIIASWYVKCIPTAIRLESFRLTSQVCFLTHTVFVQQMDVRSRTFRVSTPAPRNDAPHVRPVLAGFYPTVWLAAQISSRIRSIEGRLCVSICSLLVP